MDTKNQTQVSNEGRRMCAGVCDGVVTLDSPGLFALRKGEETTLTVNVAHLIVCKISTRMTHAVPLFTSVVDRDADQVDARLQVCATRLDALAWRVHSGYFR